jgi:hypothetical protein
MPKRLGRLLHVGPSPFVEFRAVRPLQAPGSANVSGYIKKDRINVAEASEAVRCSLR